MTTLTKPHEFIGGPLCGQVCCETHEYYSVRDPLVDTKRMLFAKGEFIYKRRADGNYQLREQR